MNSLKDWLSQIQVIGHAVAGVIAATATAVIAYQPLRDQVLQLFAKHPDIGTEIVALCGIIVTYSNFKKSQPKA